MNKKNVVIMGGGNAGRAFAAHDKLLGHRVSLVNRTLENVSQIGEAGIELIFDPYDRDWLFPVKELGLNEKDFEGTSVNEDIKNLTRRDNLVSLNAQLDGVYGYDNPDNVKKWGFDDPHLSEVIEDADIIRVSIPTTGHRNVARRLAPHIGKKKEQIISLEPGRTFGSLDFLNVLRTYQNGNSGEQKINWENIKVAETDTLIYACRIMGPREVRIIKTKRRLKLGAIPGRDAPHCVEFYQENLLPQTTMVPNGNVLYTGLGNVATILHAVLFPLWIPIIGLWRENRKDFEKAEMELPEYYRDITYEMGRILEEADEKERLEIARKFGIYIPSIRKWIEEDYGVEAINLYGALRACPGYDGIKVPQDINYRYGHEDVRNSAIPISGLGRTVGVSTPIINGSIATYSSAIGKDLRKDGRTMENIGLGGMGPEEISDLVLYGFPEQQR